MDGTHDLVAAVAARFVAVNGNHPMTTADDAYVSEYYVPLDELAETAGVEAGELRRQMLSNRLPLPSYVHSNGAQMVARDLLELAGRAGGADRLPEWFAAHFPEPPFVPYDRLRFGGPVSRDRLVDEPRRRYPRT
jgi:hypothetical protein